MEFLKEGSKVKAFCNDCGDIVYTTMQYRDVPFDDRSAIVKDILVGVCDGCNRVISIPAQSTPAIAKAKRQAQRPVEANVPAVFVEMLDYACYQLNSQTSTDLRKRLVMFYVHQYSSGELNKDELVVIHKDIPIYSRNAVKKKRLSFKVTDEMTKEMQALSDQTHLGITELLKSVVLKIKNDIVDSKATKQTISALKSFAVASTC